MAWQLDAADAAPIRPVSWADLKAHMRIDSDTDQAYGESLIDAAADYAEDRMGCTLMQRTRTETFYTGQSLDLIRGPIISITSIVDADDRAVTDYEIEKYGHLDRLRINSSYSLPIVVTYEAGYASSSAIPAAVRIAILQHAATLYENRESVSDRQMLPVPHSLDDFYNLKSRTGVAG